MSKTVTIILSPIHAAHIYAVLYFIHPELMKSALCVEAAQSFQQQFNKKMTTDLRDDATAELAVARLLGKI